MKKPILTLTDKALTHIKTMLLEKEQPAFFRLSIKKTGCTGLMYVPEIATEIKEADIKVDNAFDLPIYIDGQWQYALVGTEMDYVEKSFGQKVLSFNNPNADSLCGCGESFNLKDE